MSYELNTFPIYTDKNIMKIALLLFSISLISPLVVAQELTGPTDADLMAVSLHFLDQSKQIMTSNPKKDCDENMSKEEVKPPPMEGREIRCICEVENLKGKDKKLFFPIIGEYESSELILNNGNDNFFHGSLQRNSSTKKYDGDDRGRTFNGGVDYTLNGTGGRLNLNLDSVGFGKFTKIDGYRRTPDGEYYLNFREVNTLKLSADKYISKSEASKTFVTGEFRFTNETDNGNLSRSVQQYWHQFSRDEMGMSDVIQYKYIYEEKDKNTATIMAGIGKEWYQNLGNWKCESGLQIKVGMSVDDSKKAAAEIQARAHNKLQHSALPWLALSTWVQGSNGFQGPSVEGGLMLSVEKKIKGVIIKPFIGVERHRTPMDKKFGSVSGNSYENYHVFGVTIKY